MTSDSVINGGTHINFAVDSTLVERSCIRISDDSSAVQLQEVVSAHFTSKQILPFALAQQRYSID